MLLFDLKNAVHGKHQFSRPMQIEAPIPIKYACSITKNGGPGGRGEGGIGLTNEMPETDQVTSGPI